jgi:MSHA biogenesis protein MshL
MIIMKMKCFILVVSSCFLTACSSYFQPNPGQPTMQAIHQTLQTSFENNHHSGVLKKTTMKHLPSEVDQALLPSLKVAEPSSNTASSAKRFNISVKEVSVNAFLMGLVKDTDYNMLINPKISGSITLDLKNVTVEDVLEALHDTYGYQFRRTLYGYEVLPPGLETRVFNLHYLNMSRSGQSSISVSSGQISDKVLGGGSTSTSSTSSTGRYKQSTPSSSINTSERTDFWKNLTVVLTLMVGEQGGRQVIVNPQSGMILVKASAQELEEVASYLDSLQATMTRQVIIEAKILEVTLSKDFQSGIDWKLLGLDQEGVSTSANLGRQFSNIFKLNIHDGSHFKFIMNLLSTQGNVQVLSSPYISTLNNQKAVMKVGTDEFFITNISNTTTSTSGVGNQNTQNVDFTPFFSGIALDVTPEIDTKGDVILHIHPMISQVTDQKKKYTINDQAQEVPLALSDIRESDTVVKAKNGQVIVIGGLMGNKTSEITDSTPGPDKIPFVGSAFRNTKQSSVRSELVILLKPIVVQDSQWSKQIKNTSQRFKTLDKGYHLGPYVNQFGNLGEYQD